MNIRFLLPILFLAACQAAPQPETGTSQPEGVIVHLFEWRWEDVARECEEFLGPNGFAAVQVSPPSENHIIGGRPWFERYQPVSYQLETRSGNREAFADMVSRCSAAGVEVIADVLLNHMADADLQHEGDLVFTGTGTAGSTFGPWDYPGIYGYDDFHHCGLTPNDHIEQWDDRPQVTTCELVGLSDLDTSKPHVRSTLAAYLKDLASLGVTGFRLDAVRHIAAEDLAAILDEAGTDGYVVQEILTPGRVGPWLDPYKPLGDITEFAWTEAMGELLRQRAWSDLAPGGWFWTSRDYVPADLALVFVDNHDRQRGHGGAAAISFKDGALYQLAQVFTLAWPHGRKRVMSSYEFETDSQGPPMDDAEAIIPVYGEDGLNCGQGQWVCEHRWPTTVGAIGFHNAVAGENEVTDWWTDGRDVIAFGRGSVGFVVINGSQDTVEHVLQTSLPAGAYCNRLVSGLCQEVNVGEDGSLDIRLAPMTAVMIDTGFRPAA